MIGNPSTPAIALCLLALHASLQSSCHVVAEEEQPSIIAVDLDNGRSSHQRKHLRRPTTQQEQIDGGDDEFSKTKQQERERLRLTLESLGAKFLRGQSLAIEEERGQSLSAFVTSPPLIMVDGTNGDDNGCENRPWYPDIHNPTIACTNSHLSSSSSSSWSSDPSIIEAVLFDSSESCCHALVDLFGDDNSYNNGEVVECSVIDDCSEAKYDTDTTAVSTTATTTDTDIAQQRRLSPGCLWHADRTESDACSNDSNYPPVWGERPELRAKMLHTTAKACCDKMMPNRPCKHNDRGCVAGPPPPARPQPPTAPTQSAGGSSGCLWHVDQQLQDGCSNDSNYPDIWDRPEIRAKMLHLTATACCEKMMRGKPCKHYFRGCTPKTQRPTRQPIPPPTYPPTQSPPEYYVEESTGKCLSDKETVMPEWIKTTYTTYDRCCESGSRNSRECLRNKPETEKKPKKPGQDGTPIILYVPPKFYVDTSSGLCMSDKEQPMPDWIEETFSRYHLCCDKSVNKLLCLKAKPSLITTDDESTETYAPTPAPDILYFIDHVTGICVSELEKPIPSYITATFVDYKRCCILESKTLEKCLAKKPASDTALATGPSSAPNPMPAKFYVQDSSGLCVDEAEFPSPYSVTTYEDYGECCKTAWKKDLCLLQRPTMSPSGFPTMAPSTPWPTEPGFCPEPYDSSGATKYKRNSEVEVDQVVYRCKPAPYSSYCNKSDFRPPQEDPGPEPKPQKNSDDPDAKPIAKINKGGGAGPLWKDVWERLYMCVYSPTEYPTPSPNTPAPSCKTRWHPGDIGKKICTNSAIFPVLWSQDPILRVAYFADTADECCEKFYPRQKCRRRDEC